jgi:hypothetical protein
MRQQRGMHSVTVPSKHATVLVGIDSTDSMCHDVHTSRYLSCRLTTWRTKPVSASSLLAAAFFLPADTTKHMTCSAGKHAPELVDQAWQQLHSEDKTSYTSSASW